MRPLVEHWLIAVQALDKVQNMFPQLLSAHTLDLFSTLWQSLQAHLGPYHELYVNETRQGRMEDADRLPYTLDFLVIEELDYIQTLLSTAPVRREMEAQVSPDGVSNGVHEGTWITQVMTILVGYAQITQEEEALWDFDVNVFLSEETSETANYSPRNACSNFVTKLCRWPVVDHLLTHTRTIFGDAASRFDHLDTSPTRCILTIAAVQDSKKLPCTFSSKFWMNSTATARILVQRLLMPTSNTSDLLCRMVSRTCFKISPWVGKVSC